MVPAEALKGLAGVALFAAPGAGLAELLPAVRELPAARRLAHAWLLGVAWTAGALYALSHWLAVPLRPPAILAVAAAPVLAGAVSWLRRRRPPSVARRKQQRPKRLVEWLALGAAVLVSLALLCDTLNNPLTDWDGRMTWSAQARYVRSEGTVHPAALTQRGWYVSHPWYPLLMPLAQVAVLEATRSDLDHHAFRPLYGVFFPVWLLLIYGGALVLLLSWRAGVPESFESFEQATSWSLLWPGIVTRVPRLARDARAEMVSFLDWGLFWSAAPLVLAAGWRGLRRRPAAPLLLAAAIPLGVGWIYATVSLRPDFVVRSTWNRFLLQASVPLLVLFALALRDLLRRAGWVPRGFKG